MVLSVEECESIACDYINSNESVKSINIKEVAINRGWGFVGLKHKSSSRYVYTKVLLIHPDKEVVVKQYKLKNSTIENCINTIEPPSSVNDWYWSMSDLATLVFDDMDANNEYKAKIVYKATQINKEAVILTKANVKGSMGSTDFFAYRIHLSSGQIIDKKYAPKGEKDDIFEAKKRAVKSKAVTPVPTEYSIVEIGEFVLEKCSEGEKVKKSKLMRIFQNDGVAVVGIKIQHSRLKKTYYACVLDFEDHVIVDRRDTSSYKQFEKYIDSYITEAKPGKNRQTDEEGGLLEDIVSNDVVQTISRITNPDSAESFEQDDEPKQQTQSVSQSKEEDVSKKQQPPQQSSSVNTSSSEKVREESKLLSNTEITLDLTKEPETVPDVPDVTLDFEDIELDEQIGSGGNADVSKATVTVNSPIQNVALKQPRIAGTLNGEVIEELLSEAETWSKLNDSEYIVSVLDYGADPIPWIAMEYMDDGNLADRLDDVAPQEALWIGTCVARAVRHAHRHGVVHLDLKPENVLFAETSDGVWDVPKVADWGLAKRLLEHSQSVDGLTPHYAAPEQFDSEEYGPVDDQTDIYATGMLVYAALVGEPPFTGSTASVMQDILSSKPTPPSERVDGLPQGCDDVILKALSKEKEQRYDAVLDFRRDLEMLLNEY